MIIGLLLSSAWADIEVSDSLGMAFESTTPVLSASSLDSGWVPSSGAIQIRLQVNLEQEATVAANANSTLTWNTNIPSELSMSTQGIPNSGLFTINGLMDVLISLRFSLMQFEWEGDFFERSIPLLGETIYNPMTWESPIEVTPEGDGTEVLDYSQSLLTILTGSLTGELRPNCNASLTEQYLDVNGDRVSSIDGTFSFNSRVGDASLQVPLSYQTEVYSNCSIQLIPSVSVSGPIIGTNSLEITQIDLPSVEQTTPINLVPPTMEFPLASISLSEPSLSLESVEAGNTQNLELVLSNLGDDSLEGTLELVDDSGSFQLFGSDFSIASQQNSSVVISFEGAENNQYYEALLVVQSNDPSQPVIQVPISATTNPEASTDNEDTNDVNGLDDDDKSGCSNVGNASIWLGIFSILSVRRRRD